MIPTLISSALTLASAIVSRLPAPTPEVQQARIAAHAERVRLAHEERMGRIEVRRVRAAKGAR